MSGQDQLSASTSVRMMPKKGVPLYRVPIGLREKIAGLRVLSSNRFTSQKNLIKLENKVSNLTGAKYAVAMANGTLPLFFALKHLNLSADDEVIVPSFTFVATANVVALAGAKPVIVDISLKNFSIDLELIEGVLTSKTRAILFVHQFGFMVDLSKLKEILVKRNQSHVEIIEDSACALGSKKHGGTSKFDKNSLLASYSFHPRKIITSGEGGIIATDRESVAIEAKKFRNHGLILVNDEQEYYYPSINARLSELQAAILLPQLNRIEKIIEKRKELAEVYLSELDGSLFVLPDEEAKNCTNWQSFFVISHQEFDYFSFKKHMSSRNFTVARGAQFIPNLEYFRNSFELDPNNYPVGSKAGRLGFCLPIYPALRSRVVKKIAAETNRFFASPTIG